MLLRTIADLSPAKIGRVTRWFDHGMLADSPLNWFCSSDQSISIMMKRLSNQLFAGLLFGFVALSIATAADHQDKPIKALMVAGGCCHDYVSQTNIIAKGISVRANVEWTIVHEGEKSRDHEVSIYNNPYWAKGFDVVVHNECFGGVTNVALVNRIAKAHENGMPAVMLHCSTHSYRLAKTDEWRKTLGQSSFSHEKRRDLVVENLKPEHPIMKGFPVKWEDPNDELYKNEKLWPNVVPLAKAYGEDTKKDHVVIWTNSHGKGRVFATTLGHTNETMESPVYLDLVTRGMLWAVGRLEK